MKHLRLNGRQVREDKPFFIVEEGQAHGGDLGMALRMVGLAARTGADAVEFQLAVADDFYVPSHPNHLLYRRREFTPMQCARLVKAAHAKKVAFSAMVLSERLFYPLAKAGCDLFHVNSSDITNARLLDAVAGTGKPFLIGTAMATAAEMDWAVNRLFRRGARRFGLMHGQHVMAAAEKTGVVEKLVSLRSIPFLHRRYGVPVGFTDHTSNPAMPALAVAAGAALVSKHLAPRRPWRGPDWFICLSPVEMAECVRLTRLAGDALGAETRTLSAGELADRRLMRRSVVAARDLPAKTRLKAADLSLKRPGGGLDPVFLEKLYARWLAKPVAANRPLAATDIKGGFNGSRTLR